MKKIINILMLSLILCSCNNNKQSSLSQFNSSLFDNKEIIVDPGNYDEKATYYVDGKVESSTGNKVIPFNTQMFLNTYSNDVYNKLGSLYDYHIKRLHILFDRYNLYLDENGNIINNLKVINDSYAKNKEIIIDEDLFNLLEISIELSKLTKGYFNPTMGSLIDGWNGYFSPFGMENEEFTIEEEERIISRRNSIVDYQDLEKVIELNKEKSSVKFNKYEKAGINTVILSLGAIAKGYAVDYFRKLTEKHNVPLIISGSASSSFVKGINPNPSRDNWTVLINSPYKNDILQSLPLLVCEVNSETSISTSGDYEQLFYYQNNDELVRRHHILNPYSGHSEDYYRSVTLFSESRSDILDGLSTALFNIDDFKEVNDIIEDVEEYYNLNIDYLFQKEVDDQKVNLYLNEGFEKTISKRYEDVEIIEVKRVDYEI